MPLLLDLPDDLVHVLLADLVAGGLDHHADDRLGAALAHQDAAVVAQRLGHLLHGGLHVRVVLRVRLALHAHVLQNLRVELHRGRQLAHRLLLRQHDLHHLQARQNAVAGGLVLREDDVAALLAADAVAVLDHVLVDVLVAHLGLLVVDARLVQRLVEAEVAHHGRHDRVVQQLSALLHVQAIDVEDVVAGDHVALLVHRQAAVRVAVKGEAHVQLLVAHQLLQMLDVGRAAVHVDVVAVGLGVDHVGLRAQRVEDALGDLPGSAVGAVKAHAHVAEAVAAHRDQVADVAVAARDVVHGPADVLAVGDRDLQPVVDVLLDLQDRLLVHLLAFAVEELDAVVVERVVAGGDHDAAVKVVHAGDVGHRGRGGDVHDVGVRAGGHQARAQRVLEHVGGPAGVLADDHLALLALARAVVPAQEAADLDRVLKRQRLVGFAAEAVRAEIFSHITAAPPFQCPGSTCRRPRSARRRPPRRRR